MLNINLILYIVIRYKYVVIRYKYGKTMLDILTFKATLIWTLLMFQTAELGSFAPEIKFDKFIGAPEIYYRIIPIITRASEV